MILEPGNRAPEELALNIRQQTAQCNCARAGGAEEARTVANLLKDVAGSIPKQALR